MCVCVCVCVSVERIAYITCDIYVTYNVYIYNIKLFNVVYVAKILIPTLKLVTEGSIHKYQIMTVNLSLSLFSNFEDIVVYKYRPCICSCRKETSFEYLY